MNRRKLRIAFAADMMDKRIALQYLLNDVKIKY
jgi:hypothetical protein